MDETSEVSGRDDERLLPGAPVSVQNTFTGHWNAGFFIAGDDADGYWLHRGDGSALPTQVGHDRVRSRD